MMDWLINYKCVYGLVDRFQGYITRAPITALKVSSELAYMYLFWLATLLIEIRAVSSVSSRGIITCVRISGFSSGPV